MPKTIHQNVTFRASPDALFDTYLSSPGRNPCAGRDEPEGAAWMPSIKVDGLTPRRDQR
jgi:hypothetical protein